MAKGDSIMSKSIFHKNAFKIVTRAKSSRAIKYLDGGFRVEVEVKIWIDGQPETETIEVFRNCLGEVSAIII